MNEEQRDAEVEQLLANAGRAWRETLPPSPDPYPAFARRATVNPASRPGARGVSLAGVLAVVAVAVLVVMSMPRPNGQTGNATPSASPFPTANPTANPGVLTPAEAIDRVVAFVGEPALTADLVANGPNDGNGLAFYEVANAHLTAEVDSQTGAVVSVLFLDSDPPLGEGPTADEAIAIAEAYVVDRGIAVDGMTRTVERKDHGETWEWSVEWVRMAGNVILPDNLAVGVDPFGNVFRFVSYKRPYSSPPAPEVDQATAETYAAEAAFGDEPRTRIDSATLRLLVYPNGGQQLVWQIQVSAWAPGQSGTEPMLHAWVEVDALTGETRTIGLG